jgi:hypothetical protein
MNIFGMLKKMYTVYNIFKSILSYLKVLKLIISLTVDSLKLLSTTILSVEQKIKSFCVSKQTKIYLPILSIKKTKTKKTHYSWTVPHPIEKIVERQILIPLTQKYMTSHKKDMGKYIFVCFNTTFISGTNSSVDLFLE